MRLRWGRFAWELYYTRTKAVLPWEERRRRLAILCGHLGYFTGFFEYVMTDMLYLRSFALSGCIMIIGFQASQPKIQWLSVGWNSLYSAVNAVHIYWLVRRLPALTEESKTLWLALGGEQRLPQKYFQELLDMGEWRFLHDNETLTEQDSDASLSVREVAFISTGGCTVYLNGLQVTRLGPGGVVGEIGALSLDNEPNSHLPHLPHVFGKPVPRPSATVRAGPEGMRCLCVPLERLEDSAELLDALHSVFTCSLASKVLELESKTLQYAAMLELTYHSGAKDDGVLAAEVARFREKHGITDEDHEWAEATVRERLGLAPPRPPPSSGAAPALAPEE